MAVKRRGFLQKLMQTEEMEQYINLFPSNVSASGYDPWGFNLEGVRNTIGIAKFLYEKFFRVESFGLENIPKEGRCLVIANHSGQLPLDGLLIGYALLTNPHGPRAAKAMIERFLPTVPFVGNWLNSLGAVIGDPVNCERMLEMEEAIIVFPEGVRGSGKLFKDRYKLQRFGHGFMHLAMKHKTPIIPVGVVGCEESIISFADIKPLAKLLGIPYAPLVIPVVLPTKVYLHFGEPMYFENDVHTEHQIQERVDMVKASIKELINKGLSKRQSIF
jgi:1-acyl-sn-glycerol-3-phosphate acyltransferase